MNRYYKTGEFAKIANVTQRTIRYYDKIGLLKPSFTMENGYRQYSEQDFIKLQKILFLKQLGFAIEEIYPLINDEESLIQSMKLQLSLINKQINHYIILKDSLKSTLRLIEKQTLEHQDILGLIQLFSMENSIVEQYKNEHNLRARIHLHRMFSVNTIDWYTWLLQEIKPAKFNRILEVGCGDGTMWENLQINTRNREIYLSDASEGMVDTVRKKYGNDFNCLMIHCEQIPFKNENFDCIIANHVLFYLNDIELGLEEINRVLSINGSFYCSSYGLKHMKELSVLVKEFDPRIKLSEQNLAEKFGLENGETILKKYFHNVKLHKYEDALQINQVQPLVDYVISCHGNQNEIINKRLDEFKQFLADKLKEKKYIHITKDAGLFICQK